MAMITRMCKLYLKGVKRAVYAKKILLLSALHPQTNWQSYLGGVTDSGLPSELSNLPGLPVEVQPPPMSIT